MKLLIFAHTPPPHHGQSYMVQLMLEGFGGDARNRTSHTPHPLDIECYHVNARFSRGLSDIGKFQSAKFLLVFWFCAQALWIRFRYGVTNFYYVPAPGKRVALYRDWLVMFLCRPFFKHVILHWQAAGLAQWLETDAQKNAQNITKRLFQPVNLSVILSSYNRADATQLRSQQIALVNNCAPDQCPDFANNVQPRRQARHAARVRLLANQPVNGSLKHAGSRPDLVNVLFLAHCTREKGLFDAMEGCVLANRELAGRGVPLRVKLSVAGGFVEAEEKQKFNQLLTQPEYAEGVEYLGFVAGENKHTLLLKSDVLCFPSFYLGENQPVSMIEAMSFGLPIVTTRWRSLPEMLPPDYPGLVPTQSPPDIAKALIHLIAHESGERLRQHYLAHFTLERYLDRLAQAFHHLETAPKQAPKHGRSEKNPGFFITTATAKPKLLVMELWGVGDLAMATPFLQAAAKSYEVTLLAKPFAQELQPRLWPEVKVVPFDAPWTAFRGKYNVWRWPWRQFTNLRRFAGTDFEYGLSPRPDPRDHALMNFLAVKNRVGFPRLGSKWLLTTPLVRPPVLAHRYDYWRDAGKALGFHLPARHELIFPINHTRSRWVSVHSGAARAVRVWPLPHYLKLIQNLRSAGFEVRVICDPDQRTWWLKSGEAAVTTPATIGELMDLLAGAAAFIGNDSGPGHLAAISGVPTFTLFGPQLPELFAPLHPQAEWIPGDPCVYKPCKDYCHYTSARCMQDLTEERIWPRLLAFVQAHMAEGHDRPPLKT